MSIWTNVGGYIKIPKEKHISLKEDIINWFDGSIVNTIKQVEITDGLVRDAWSHYIEFCFPKGNKDGFLFVNDWLHSLGKIKYDIDVTVRMLN